MSNFYKTIEPSLQTVTADTMRKESLQEMLTSARLLFKHVRLNVEMENNINKISTNVGLLHKRLKEQKHHVFA